MSSYYYDWPPPPNSFEYCPICDNKHPIHQMFRSRDIKIGKIKATYIEISYVCCDTGIEFIPAKVMDENVQRAREALEEAEAEGEDNG